MKAGLRAKVAESTRNVLTVKFWVAQAYPDPPASVLVPPQGLRFSTFGQAAAGTEHGLAQLTHTAVRTPLHRSTCHVSLPQTTGSIRVPAGLVLVPALAMASTMLLAEVASWHCTFLEESRYKPLRWVGGGGVGVEGWRDGLRGG
jgi:hypothetical protein